MRFRSPQLGFCPSGHPLRTMKIRFLIAASWAVVTAAFASLKLMPQHDLLITAAAILFLISRIFIPIASPTLKNIAMYGFIATAILLFIPWIGVLAFVSALACFAALAWSDVLVLKKHENVA